MEEKIVSVTKKNIGGTVYIVESAVSEKARETAYDKVKRLVLQDTKNYQKKSA